MGQAHLLQHNAERRMIGDRRGGLWKSGGHWPNQTLSSNACPDLDYPI